MNKNADQQFMGVLPEWIAGKSNLKKEKRYKNFFYHIEIMDDSSEIREDYEVTIKKRYERAVKMFYNLIKNKSNFL
ncbi:hypothetical protein [Vaginella massiliensis]|uniref:hypothetical protein n=1 Tax=Vaginella massiliensis TaxID=1816680 RepID=UPI0008398021|nr:hypothetical protein [Vaginella massiliensis]